MRLAQLTLAAVAVSAASADGTFGKIVRAKPLPDTWEEVMPLSAGVQEFSANRVVRVLVSLKPANEGAIQEIEKHATAVSDPNDAYYGKYLSMEEVNALRAPDPDARGRVLDFFAQYRHRD